MWRLTPRASSPATRGCSIPIFDPQACGCSDRSSGRRHRLCARLGDCFHLLRVTAVVREAELLTSHV
jgi:hypothetical protein